MDMVFFPFVPPRHIYILLSNTIVRLLPVPHAGDLGVPHLLLQLENAKHERLGGRRTSGHVDIHRHNAVATSGDTVGVVVVATTVGAAAHGDDPSRVRHLIVDLAKGGCHLVGEGTGDNHDVGLARRGTENDSHAILIVTGRGKVHHLNSAAGKTESHGPERALARPVCDLVECGAGVMSALFLSSDCVLIFLKHTVRIA